MNDFHNYFKKAVLMFRKEVIIMMVCSYKQTPDNRQEYFHITVTFKQIMSHMAIVFVNFHANNEISLAETL